MRRWLAAAALIGAGALALWLLRAPAPSPPPEPLGEPEAVTPDPGTPPAPDRHPDVSRAAKPRKRLEPRPAPSPPPAPSVLLDDLLRLPALPAGPQSLEPDRIAPGSEAEAAEAGRRVRIDFSRHAPLADAPVPRPWTRTEAGVSVPVGEAERVRIRGGVRVDERGTAEANREVEATPSLGLELRF